MPTPGFQPIDKPVRVKDRVLLDRIKGIGYCEYCGRSDLRIDPHHIKSVGSGGNDLPLNILGLCLICHDNAHRGKIKKIELFRIAIEREKRLNPDVGIGTMQCPCCGPTDQIEATLDGLCCTKCGSVIV